MRVNKRRFGLSILQITENSVLSARGKQLRSDSGRLRSHSPLVLWSIGGKRAGRTAGSRPRGGQVADRGRRHGLDPGKDRRYLPGGVDDRLCREQPEDDGAVEEERLGREQSGVFYGPCGRLAG